MTDTDYDVRQVVPKDAIPSVDEPRFIDTYDGDPDDQVIAVDLHGEARAYPIRYLHYHEIVNDVLGIHPGETDGDSGEVGELAIAVTWCPLCGSAVVYDRQEVIDGEFMTLEFGVSGKLADDDLVMYDRETESEWKQSTGECLSGKLRGSTLDVLPSSVTTWTQFRETYPDGVVLAPPGGASEASGPGDEPEPIDYDTEPYDEYFERTGFGLEAHRGTGGREWDRDDIDPKTVVLGIERENEALGFPLPIVESEGNVVTATVGDTDVVIFATDAGIHAFENPVGLEFEHDAGRFVADGTVWNGASGTSDDGRQLTRIPARRLFAFAWQDDHGRDAFYGLD